MLDKVADVLTSSHLRPDDDYPSVASALMATLDVLETSRVPYVVLHGYERFPQTSGSDVDICIDRSVSGQWVCKLLAANAGIIGARVVSCRDGAIILAGETVGHRSFFLKLDLDRDYALNGLCLIPGAKILAARRSCGTFHVPSPAHQAAGYLATALLKGKFDTARTRRLASLYRSDPTGSATEIAYLFPDAERGLLLRALADDQWGQVIASAPQFRTGLIARLRSKDPNARVARTFGKLADRLGRLIRPRGLSVVVLGPDGAGKSSITDAIGGLDLLPVFDRSVCWGFVPPVHRLFKSQGSTSRPHALPPRSLVGSLMKAGYWLAFSFLLHPRTHVMKARGGLVLYDRHFVDILIDAKRYRYKGPDWALRAIWAIIPKPDLVVLLDAPAEIIQKRKNELSVEETARQLEAYRKLVEALPNGVILDANKPFADVVEALNRVVLTHYSSRGARAVHGLVESI